MLWYVHIYMVLYFQFSLSDIIKIYWLLNLSQIYLVKLNEQILTLGLAGQKKFSVFGCRQKKFWEKLVWNKMIKKILTGFVMRWFWTSCPFYTSFLFFIQIFAVNSDQFLYFACRWFHFLWASRLFWRPSFCGKRWTWFGSGWL